jgi:cysteine desulfurase family protein
MARNYLDNAATSWPKPPEVYAAVERYMRELGAPAGRSSYSEAAETERAVASARLALARLLGVSEPQRIVFALNGTDALNTAIHGVLHRGDHVVTSVIEHNSVLRPLRELEEAGTISVTRVDCDDAGRIDPDDVKRAISGQTRLVVLAHASNVTGAVTPIEQIAPLVEGTEALLLVDAAQTAGHRPIDVENLGIDLLAAPGHKGLLGPLGTGVLYVSPRAEVKLRSTRQGGTGTHSEEDRQPGTLPDKFESGSLNVPGILGLGAGATFLRTRGVGTVAAHLEELLAELVGGIRELPGVQLYGPPPGTAQGGIVSITVEGYDPHEVATVLDASHHIQVRSGIHCAPRMHQRLGTLDHGGTVRFSPGPFTTKKDIEAAVEAISELATASAST